MDRPTGVFINYLTVCCQSLSIKKMIELTQEELKQYFSEPIFGHIAETADALGLECYVVGGYVRDIFLQRPSKDIDVVVVGSGIAMAEALGKRLGRGEMCIRDSSSSFPDSFPTETGLKVSVVSVGSELWVSWGA